MEKSCPEQEGHPPSQVNFSGCLYEKKVDPFARVKSWVSNNNGARACSDRLALAELTLLGEPKCLYGEKLARLGGDPARRVTLLAEPIFCFLYKRFVKFCEEMYEKLARPG